MNTVAIVGGGELAQSWQDKNNVNYKIDVYTREQFDLSQRTQCDHLIDLLYSKDIVIITAGSFDKDLWNTWLINLVAPAYVVSQLIEKNYSGHVIVISSNAANWTSWPDININRLTYNNAKHAVSNFIYGVIQGKFAGRYSVIEPSKFKSNMSNYQGQDIEQVVETIDFVINTKVWNIKL